METTPTAMAGAGLADAVVLGTWTPNDGEMHRVGLEQLLQQLWNLRSTRGTRPGGCCVNKVSLAMSRSCAGGGVLCTGFFSTG